MQTHDDRSHDFGPSPFMRRLHQRADEAVKAYASLIASDGIDAPIAEWKGENGFHVKRLADDEQGILRISVGGGIEGLDGNYCTFRGDPHKCLYILRAAAAAMAEKLP